jgi:caa(3)-type oxidase subunit IV
MSESHAAASHADSHVKAYLMVFVALAVLTAATFGVYESFPRHSQTAFVIILAIAFAKAALVASVFMHLIADWKRVYMLIVPALILGPMLMIVLLPDIVLLNRPGSPVRLVPPPDVGAPVDIHP